MEGRENLELDEPLATARVDRILPLRLDAVLEQVIVRSLSKLVGAWAQNEEGKGWDRL